MSDRGAVAIHEGPAPALTLPDREAKELPVGGRRFVRVPVARRPPGVRESEWRTLCALNDHILDRVKYDDARAAQTQGVRLQTPAETLRRGRGVCMDIAALFEHLARAKGFTVMSASSDELDHAWNTVLLAGSWWIVDVTWNGTGRSTGGTALPDSVRRDPDFRRQYLLTTVAEEVRLAEAGLLSQTHAASDTRVIDYERTFEVRELTEKVNAAVDRFNTLVHASNALVREANRWVEKERELVAEHNASPSAEQRARLKRRIEDVRKQTATYEARLETHRAESGPVEAEIGQLRARIASIKANNPLAIKLLPLSPGQRPDGGR